MHRVQLRHRSTACSAHNSSLPFKTTQGLGASCGACSIVRAFGSFFLSLLQEYTFPWKSVQHPHATAIATDQPRDISYSAASERWGCSCCSAAAKQQRASQEEQAAGPQRSQVRLFLALPGKTEGVFVDVAFMV